MDRFIDQLREWFRTASGYVADGVGLIQEYVIVIVLVIAILAGLAYFFGFVPLRYFERVKDDWIGSVIVGLLIIFGLGTILIAMLPT